MIAEILILALVGLLQSTVIPGPWLLLILISRSFIMEDRTNYWLGFVLGLWLSLISGEHLGILSLIYIVIIKLVHLIKKIPLSSRWWMIIPISFVMLTFSDLAEGILFHRSLLIIPIIGNSLISLPIYILVRFWEERFIPSKEVKLHI